MVTKKVLFVVASTGYHPVEYGIPKRRVEESGFTVVTTSNAPGTAYALDESSTKVDVALADVTIDHYDGLFFVGGPQTLEHLDNEVSYQLIKKAVAAKKPLGAICIATRILANAGILKGHKATGWNGDNKLVQLYLDSGALYLPKEVVVDENLITALGPSAVREYAECVITLLHDCSGWG